MEDDDFVVAMAKVFEAVEQAIRVVEEVGDDDDEAAAHNAFGQFVEGGGKVGIGAFGAGVLKGGEQGEKWLVTERGGRYVRMRSSKAISPTASRWRNMRWDRAAAV